MNYEVQNFQKDVIEKSYKIPVLVDFWAEWCGPCKMLSPILERLAEKYKDKWALAKIDTDANQETAIKYGIRGIPNVKLFINGEITDEFSGALPERMVEEWLKKAIPNKYQEKIESARKLIVENKIGEAKKMLQKILSAEPENNEAKILLAKIFLFEDNSKALKLIENLENIKNPDEIDSIHTLAGLFKKEDEKDLLPDSPVKNTYISAIEDLKGRQFDSSLEKFIRVIREDRNYDDDGARKACIAIFKYLGEENKVTLKYRRDFGSALYV